MKKEFKTAFHAQRLKVNQYLDGASTGRMKFYLRKGFLKSMVVRDAELDFLNGQGWWIL